jgi:hypothetical protein
MTCLARRAQERNERRYTTARGSRQGHDLEERNFIGAGPRVHATAAGLVRWGRRPVRGPGHCPRAAHPSPALYPDARTLGRALAKFRLGTQGDGCRRVCWKCRCPPVFPRTPWQTEVWHPEVGKLFRQHSKDAVLVGISRRIGIDDLQEGLVDSRKEPQTALPAAPFFRAR